MKYTSHNKRAFQAFRFVLSKTAWIIVADTSLKSRNWLFWGPGQSLSKCWVRRPKSNAFSYHADLRKVSFSPSFLRTKFLASQGCCVGSGSSSLRSIVSIVEWGIGICLKEFLCNAREAGHCMHKPAKPIWSEKKTLSQVASNFCSETVWAQGYHKVISISPIHSVPASTASFFFCMLEKKWWYKATRQCKQV